MSNCDYNLFLEEIDNVIALSENPNDTKQYNYYIFRQLGITSKRGQKLLFSFSKFLFVLNVVFSAFYFVLCFFKSCFYHFFVSHTKSTNYIDLNNSYLFLFFTSLLYDRSISSGIFGMSKYWLIGPGVATKRLGLSDKILINYKNFLHLKDYLAILGKSLSLLKCYAKHYECLYQVYNAWDFYSVEYAFSKIRLDKTTLVFSNQIDRWALLFDSLPSNGKVLLQHGIGSNTVQIPHKLHNVSIFYSMSNLTWRSVYYSFLDCMPAVKLMKNTIELSEIPSHKFSVLIVSEVTYYNFEAGIINALQNKGVDIYLKKHPTLKNDSCYTHLLKRNDFHYISQNYFPKVDFVISYYSTLAYEYLACGIPVYIYYSKNDFNLAFVLNQIDELKKNK